ncbi:MAG: glycyl radical protein [Deltaproteobacteria bacterium]|jgi:formate C-acetyltransferase|nr:glycyl radical protein [Deltaproteobacteria bacterium]
MTSNLFLSPAASSGSQASWPDLSPQELRLGILNSGQIAPLAEKHSRANLLIGLSQGLTPAIDIERALYFTRSMAETEGQPLVLRWAKALYKIAENISIYLTDHQLLLGRVGRPGRYGILYPELDGDFLGLAVSALPNRPNSPAIIEPKDAEAVIQEISPYWKGRTYHEALNLALPPEVRALTYDDADGLTSRFIVNETSSFRSSIQWVHDYERILKYGFKDVARRAQEKLDRLDFYSPLDQTQRKPFYEAVLIVCEAVALWARRYSEAARQKAAGESDQIRRQELVVLADMASRVPWEPARNFYEAVQSQWFTQLFSRLEQKTGTIISNGRMDQYLWPFYESDLKIGAIDEDKALELFECLWVGLYEFVDLYISPAGGAFNEGYAHWEAVTVGGQKSDGSDATNALSHLLLRSKREFPLHYPDLAARVHSRSPRAFLWDVAETIKDGSGFPKLINDEEVVPLLVKKGADFSEALDYAVSGCTEARMPNRDTYTSGGAYVNFAAALEMALREGRMLKYGTQLLGVPTGPADKFKSFDELWEAYLSQHLYLMRAAFIQQYHVNRLRAEHFAQPMGSAVHELCLEHGVDLHQEYIPEGLDFGYIEFIGYATVVDSLAAIKKTVFEDHTLTMTEVVAALNDDFKGHEVTRAILKKAPRYGNSDPYADSLAKKLDRISVEYCQKYSVELGINNDIRYVPFTSHVPFGKVVSATPNGRTAWFPLSDGSSPSHGADLSGPTAILLSNFNSKNIDLSARASRMVNIKFSPSCVAGDEGTERLVEFIRSFVDLKLWHVQFNVINQDTLIAAQKDPASFRHLIVRIAGYSAYFTDLSLDLQNDLIARSNHGAW